MTNEKLFQASDAVHAETTYDEDPGRYRVAWSAEGKPGAMVVALPGAGVVLAVHRATDGRPSGPLMAFPVPCDRRRMVKRVEFVVTYDDEEATAPAPTPKHRYVRAAGPEHRSGLCECCEVCGKDPRNSAHLSKEDEAGPPRVVDVPTLVAELSGRTIKEANIQPMDPQQPSPLPAALLVRCEGGPALFVVLHDADVNVRSADGYTARSFPMSTVGPEARAAALGAGLRELLDKTARGYVDAPCLVRLRRLAGIVTGDEIMLSEVQEARRDRPAVKIDLGTHAATARAAADRWPPRERPIEMHGDPEWALTCSRAERAHIAANGPDATLALVTYARELERELESVVPLIYEGAGKHENQEVEVARIKALLARGPVLP